MMTEWGTRYNCDCVMYDSFDGKLLPGNRTAFDKEIPSTTNVWYVETPSLDYEVCLFNMPRGTYTDELQRFPSRFTPLY